MLFPHDSPALAERDLRTALRRGRWAGEYVSLERIPPAVARLLVDPNLPSILFGTSWEWEAHYEGESSTQHEIAAGWPNVIQLESGGRLLCGADLARQQFHPLAMEPVLFSVVPGRVVCPPLDVQLQIEAREGLTNGVLMDRAHLLRVASGILEVEMMGVFADIESELPELAKVKQRIRQDKLVSDAARVASQIDPACDGVRKVLGAFYYFLAQRCRVAANAWLQEIVYGSDIPISSECLNCGEFCDDDVMWWINYLWRLLRADLEWQGGLVWSEEQCGGCVYASRCRRSYSQARTGSGAIGVRQVPPRTS